MNPRERDCLDIIERLTVRGVPPTYRQIGGEMGVQVSRVFDIIGQLERQGLVRRMNGAGRRRVLQLIPPPANPYSDEAIKSLSLTKLIGLRDAIDFAIRQHARAKVA